MPDPKQIIIPGFDANNDGQLIDASLNYDINGHRSPITIHAFKVMVKRYIDNATTVGDTNKTAVVDFCKESILRVLGQKGCEGIRFWFAIPEIGQGVSLALQGVDDKGYPLQKALMKIDFNQPQVPNSPHQSSHPKQEEKGNGKSVAEIIKENKDKSEFIGKDKLEIIHEVLASEWKP